MRTPNTVDVSLYLILGPDEVEKGGFEMLDAALGNGVSLVQYRDKRSTTRESVETVRALKTRIAAVSPDVPLIVNDRADVMLASGADGLHVGRNDLRAEEARRIIGPDAILGVTVKNEVEANAVDAGLVDYASIGGVFQTTSKVNPDPPIGLSGLERLSGIIRHRAPGIPVSAIAGIDETNTRDVVASGADGVAVIRAVAHADDPGKAAAELARLVEEGRRIRRSGKEIVG